MADTGWKYPTTNGTPATYDGSATEYTSASNAYSDDSNYATVTDNEATYKYQSYGGFGFSIPGTATILGVEITAKGKTDTGVEEDCVLVNNYASGANNIYNFSNQYFGTSETTHTYGGPTELMGFSWVPADFNDGNFWVIHRTGGGNNGRVMSLNYVAVKVYYDTPLTASVADSITIGESKTVTPPEVTPLVPNKTDAISISEVLTMANPTLPAEISENISILDAIFDVNDGVNLTRTRYDVVAVTESVSLQKVIYRHGSRPGGSTRRFGN